MVNPNDITDYRVWQKAYSREKETRLKAEKMLDEKTSEVLTSLMILEQQVKKETEKNAQLMEANKKLEVAQAQLIQSEKMASLGQLSAGIAHEINNPLAFIRSYLQALSEDWKAIYQLLNWYDELKPTLSSGHQKQINDYYENHDINFVREDFEEAISESLSGVERIVNIVSQMQVHNRQATNSFKPLNLNNPLDSAINMAKKRYSNEVTIETEFGELPTTEGEENQLNQVFLNLIINAIHATLNKDQEGIIKVSSQVEGEHIVIAISDNGTGIEPEVQKKIFDPFFTTKPVGVGTGLGMSVVYNILQSHSATIDLESEVGVGTTFRIRFTISETS